MGGLTGRFYDTNINKLLTVISPRATTSLVSATEFLRFSEITCTMIFGTSHKRPLLVGDQLSRYFGWSLPKGATMSVFFSLKGCPYPREGYGTRYQGNLRRTLRTAKDVPNV